MPDVPNESLAPSIPFEKALATAEEIHRHAMEGMTPCDVLRMAHDAFHILTEHGASIAELCREAIRRAN